MKYNGMLYGKIAGKTFPTGKTSHDWDLLEAEIINLKESLRKFICDEETWLEENGENLMAFAVSIGVGNHEPYDPEKHTTFMADEWGIEKGDMIWWFGKEEIATTSPSTIKSNLKRINSDNQNED